MARSPKGASTAWSWEQLERVNKTIKEECIRPGVPLSVQGAKQLVGTDVAYYHTARLHSSVGYVAPDSRNPRNLESPSYSDVQLMSKSRPT